MRSLFSILLLLLMIFVSRPSAQTTVNPDISVVGDIRADIHNDESIADEAEKVNLRDVEMELVVNGYLNPYVYANSTVAWHEGTNAELEELFATVLRGLPLGLNVRLGQQLVEFGRLNPIHPHAYSFIKRPLVHEHLFGDEGLNDMMARVAYLLPTGDAYTELMIGVSKGDALAAHEHEHEADTMMVDEEEESRRDPGLFARLTGSLAVSEFGELALGGSFFQSEYERGLKANIFGFDAKYKHRPNRNSMLLIETEYITRTNEHENGEELKANGWFGYVDYRFRQKYNFGGIVDFLSEEHVHDGDEIESIKTKRYGLFTGFAPVEETSLIRLVGFYNDPDESGSFWEVNLQFIFSLGPHQPHNF